MLRLQGCLGALPDQLRLVLQFGTGIGVPTALGPVAVAQALHVRAQRVPGLQRRALHRLRVTAREHGCSRASQTSSAAFAFALGGGGPIVAGGDGASTAVAGARHATAPTPARPVASPKGPSSGGQDLLGLDLPPETGEAMQVALIVLAGMLLVGMLFTKELEVATRWRQWLSRWRHRPPI